MIVSFDTIRVLWPELILLLMASWIYLGGTIHPSRRLWSFLAVAAYAVAGWVIYTREGSYWRQEDAVSFLTGPVLVDILGYRVRSAVLVMGLLFTLVTSRGAARKLGPEVTATLMLLTAGLMVVARANDLVLMFLGLEMVSIPTYVLLYLGRRQRTTAEAAAKYFFLSILASALLLYGLSFLYGIAGTTTLVSSSVAPSAGQDATSALTALALVLILAGLGFKMAAVPFHFYAPDVYQGVSHPNAALLAIAPKVAGVLAFGRVLVVGFPQGAELGWQLTLVLAVLTMTWGNVCALWQRNLRRMMAFSSIAHAGYLLIGLSVGFYGAAHGFEGNGMSSAILYLAVYALASLGTFSALAWFSDERAELSTVESLAGLASTKPLAAGVLAVCMFSLAGIPPLAGFWGKLALFTAALRVATATDDATVTVWFSVLAVAAALNAAIAAAYYLRVVAMMYFRRSTHRVEAVGGLGPATSMVVCAVLLVLIGVSPARLFEAAGAADRAARRSPAVTAPAPATALNVSRN